METVKHCKPAIEVALKCEVGSSRLSAQTLYFPPCLG